MMLPPDKSCELGQRERTIGYASQFDVIARGKNALAGCGKSEDFALLAGVRERIGSARKVFFSLH